VRAALPWLLLLLLLLRVLLMSSESWVSGSTWPSVSRDTCNSSEAPRSVFVCHSNSWEKHASLVRPAEQGGTRRMCASVQDLARLATTHTSSHMAGGKAQPQVCCLVHPPTPVNAP
jgi:hypothetical protein